MTRVERSVSYKGDGNVSGSAAVGCCNVYAGTKNSRSRRGDSVAFVARDREASDNVCSVYSDKKAS